jgi:hypothetical protein
MSVLLDVLKIVKEKRYMVLDAVSTDAPEAKHGFYAVAKKRVNIELKKFRDHLYGPVCVLVF